jgi:hypothetical protein
MATGMLFAAGKGAAGPESVTAIGGSTFSIDGSAEKGAAAVCPGLPAGTWNSFRLHLDLPGAPAPKAAEVMGIAVNGSEPTGARDAFRLSLVPGSQPHLEVMICVDAARLKTPGTWSVLGLLRWPENGPPERTFGFSVVRRPAVAQVPAGFTLIVNEDGEFRPAGVPVQETGGESGVASLAAVADPVKTALTSAELKFPNPVQLAPRGSAELVPILSGELPPGTTATRILLSAPELGLPVSATVQLIRRRWVGWLWILLVSGIALGFGLRVFLAGRQARTISRIEAANEAERIRALAESDDPVVVRDPAVKQTLMRVASTLTTETSDSLSASSIDAAVTRRRQEADKIVADAKERWSAVRARINKLQAIYDPTGPLDPAVARLVEPVKDQLEELLEATGRGVLFATERKLEFIERDLPRELGPKFDAWRGGMIKALRAFVEWTLTEEPTKKAEELIASCHDRVEVPQEANKLAGKIRNWLDNELPFQMIKEFEGVAAVLRENGFVDIGRRLDEDSKAYGRYAGIPSAIAQLDSMIDEQGTKPRKAVAHAILSWAPDSAKDNVQIALKTGRLSEGVAAVGTPPGIARPIRLGLVPELPLSPAAAAVVSPLPVVLPSRADYAVSAPTSGAAGARIHLQLIIPDPQPSPVPKFTWCGEGVTPDTSDPTKATLKSKRVGFHDAKVSLEGEVVARAAIWIGAEEGRRRLMREKLLEDWVGTTVSGLVAVAVGLVIFEPEWVGTVREMVSAFVWAFTLDLGLSRMRELAAPGLIKPAAPA